VKTALVEVSKYDWGGETSSFFGRFLCPHHGQERLDAHDVQYAGEIVGQYVQSGNFVNRDAVVPDRNGSLSAASPEP
jgi:hypothetical protein